MKRLWREMLEETPISMMFFVYLIGCAVSLGGFVSALKYGGWWWLAGPAIGVTGFGLAMFGLSIPSRSKRWGGPDT